MSQYKKEKQGALLLMRILLWGAAAICLILGFAGVNSSGLWANKGGDGGRMTMPAEGFLFFAVSFFAVDWIIQRDRP